VVAVVGLSNLSAGALSTPFSTAPFDTEATGNAAANLFGGFRQDGGPPQFRYFIGTEPTPGPGRLILDFPTPFTDGPGADFAILTNAEAWGPMADAALFEFFLNGQPVVSFIEHLGPNHLFEFDLPGDEAVANRVVVTNITPDPAGINNLATMTFDDAGVAYPLLQAVAVDVRPESSENTVNPKANGVLPVAVRSSLDVRVEAIDPRSVEFGPDGAVETHGRGHLADIDGDGQLELLLHFRIRETGIRCGDTTVSLEGLTYDGQLIGGSDVIRVLGCKTPSKNHKKP
jgi:hypothetical protein